MSFKVFNIGARVGRRAVRLPGQKVTAHNQGGQKVFSPNHFGTWLLPQPLDLVTNQFNQSLSQLNIFYLN